MSQEGSSSSRALPALFRVGLVSAAAAVATAAAAVVVAAHGVAAGLHGHAASGGVAALCGLAAHWSLAA